MNIEKGWERGKEGRVENCMEVIFIDTILTLRKVEHFLKEYSEFNN
jgi:hypothetical protein